MQCDYFDAGVCRSCTLMGVPYAAQLALKDARVREVLARVAGEAAGTRWEEPAASAEEGFRNKAKMVVTGTAADPVIGILAPNRTGVDLRACGLHEPAVAAALEPLARFVTLAALTPYDVRARRGELKHLLVTATPAGDLMVRFVLRSSEALSRLRKHLPTLQEWLPRLVVASANLQPAHAAVLEGEEEVTLTEASSLAMPVGEVVLDLRPRSFAQTNTAVAGELYRQAGSWVAGVGAVSVWDLYCGVGGFALHLTAPGCSVLGVEVSQEAVASAAGSAARLGVDARFEAGDATAWALEQDAAPDLVVVNPPRRGLAPELVAWLEEAGPRHLLYSSCHVDTLARDLAAMPSLRPVRARMFDMFPQTGHHEVLVLATRR